MKQPPELLLDWQPQRRALLYQKGAFPNLCPTSWVQEDEDATGGDPGAESQEREGLQGLLEMRPFPGVHSGGLCAEDAGKGSKHL